MGLSGSCEGLKIRCVRINLFGGNLGGSRGSKCFLFQKKKEKTSIPELCALAVLDRYLQ